MNKCCPGEQDPLVLCYPNFSMMAGTSFKPSISPGSINQSLVLRLISWKPEVRSAENLKYK